MHDLLYVAKGVVVSISFVEAVLIRNSVFQYCLRHYREPLQRRLAVSSNLATALIECRNGDTLTKSL